MFILEFLDSGYIYHVMNRRRMTLKCKLHTSECKSLWGEPERVHRISAVNIEDECTV